MRMAAFFSSWHFVVHKKAHSGRCSCTLASYAVGSIVGGICINCATVGLRIVVSQQAAKPLTALYLAARPANFIARIDDLVGESLMIPLVAIVVVDAFANCIS